MNEDLIVVIKEILESEPLELFNPEEETSSISNLELVNSRFEEDELQEEDRYIGSGNVLLAFSLLSFVLLKETKVRPLTEKEIENTNVIWSTIISQLKEQKFIRDTSSKVKSSLRVISNDKEQGRE